MDFALPEAENWQLLNRQNFPYILSQKLKSTQIIIFVPFCLYRHYGQKSTSMWEELKKSNFLPIIQWLKQRINLFKRYTGKSLSLSSGIIQFKVVYLIDPIIESLEIKEWLINQLNKVSAELSIDADVLEVSLRDEQDSTISYRTLLAPQCAAYLTSRHESKDFFVIIRLDSDDMLLPFYFHTLRTILSLMPIYTAEYPFTLIPTVKPEQTIYTQHSPFDRPTLLEFPLGVQKSLITDKQKLTLWGENNFSSIWVSKEDVLENGITHFAFPHDRIPSF